MERNRASKREIAMLQYVTCNGMETAWNVLALKFAMTRDARLSALHRGGFGPRGRASVSFGACRPTEAGSCLPDPCSELLAARS